MLGFFTLDELSFHSTLISSSLFLLLKKTGADMTVYNRSLVKLLTECDTKLTILLALNPEHELGRYHDHMNSIYRYNKLLIEFMRRFCPESTNPDTPSLFHLFVACRAFQAAVDNAILIELLVSTEAVVPALAEENSALLSLLTAYREFVKTADQISLIQQ